MTKLTIRGLPRGAGSPTVKKFFEKSGVAEKWAQSGWAKKRAAVKARRSLSDFDRFNVMLLKKQRRNVLSPATKKASA
jgi:large subunit ribosomal protein L14e